MNTPSTWVDTTINLTRVIKAPRERVYAAFTTPALAKQWWSGAGWTHTELVLDAHPGGTWRFQMRNDESGQIFTSEGEYLEAIEPARLRWTNRWNDDGVQCNTQVTVTFTAVAGWSAVYVLHEFFPDKSTCASHQAGWGGCLDQLATLLQSAR